MKIQKITFVADSWHVSHVRVLTKPIREGKNTFSVLESQTHQCFTFCFLDTLTRKQNADRLSVLFVNRSIECWEQVFIRTTNGQSNYNHSSTYRARIKLLRRNMYRSCSEIEGKWSRLAVPVECSGHKMYHNKKSRIMFTNKMLHTCPYGTGPELTIQQENGWHSAYNKPKPANCCANNERYSFPSGISLVRSTLRRYVTAHTYRSTKTGISLVYASIFVPAKGCIFKFFFFNIKKKNLLAKNHQRKTVVHALRLLTLSQGVRRAETLPYSLKHVHRKSYQLKLRTSKMLISFEWWNRSV